MKNVTPAAGQVWGNGRFKFKIRAIDLPHILFTDGETTTIDGLYSRYKFISQSDLEWLAVNEPDWFHPLCNWIRRDDNGRPMYTSDPHHPLIKMYTYYTREQWQNMRYELGLDERTPKEAYREFDRQIKRDLEEAEIRNCPVRGPLLKKLEEETSKIRNEFCDYLMNDEETGAIRMMNATIKFRRTMTSLETLQKDTKMIDLNHCKIDDKFVTARGRVMTAFAFGHNSVVMRDEEGQFNVFDIDSGCVITFKTGPQYDIVSKHDPRTNEERAIDDLLFMVNPIKTNKCKSIIRAIKADKIHGIKWVGE